METKSEKPLDQRKEKKETVYFVLQVCPLIVLNIYPVK